MEAVCRLLHEPVSLINLVRNMMVKKKEVYDSIIVNNVIEEVTNGRKTRLQASDRL